MTAKKVTIFDKLAFGLGSGSDAMHFIGFKVFAFFYYTQILQLPGTSVGIAIAIAIVIDSISDPLVGLFSDRLRSKIGNRHILMFCAIIPTSLSFYFLFNPPLGLLENESLIPGTGYEQQLFFYLLAVVLTLRLSITFFSVPHLALGAEMSNDYLERSKIYSFHTYFLWVGSAPILFLSFQFLFPFEDGGMRNSAGYRTLGIIYGLMMATFMLLSTVFTLKFARKTVATITPPNAFTAELKQKLISVVTDLQLLFTNKNFLVVFIGFLCIGSTSGIHETLNSHLVNYYWQFTTEQYSYYSIASGIAYLAMFVLGVKFHRIWDKKLILILGAGGKCILTALPLLLMEFGLFPAVGSQALFYTVVGFIGWYYFTQSLLIMTVTSCLGDLADEFKLQQGRNREGLFYSARSFINKAMSGIGTFVAGIGLTLIAFPLGGDIEPGAIEPEILTNLVILYSIGSAFSMLAFILFFRYDMNKVKHAQIIKQLNNNALI